MSRTPSSGSDGNFSIHSVHGMKYGAFFFKLYSTLTFTTKHAPLSMDFFQSPSMLCATGWVLVCAKMAAETAGFSVAEIKSLKLNVLRSYLPNIYFQLGYMKN